MAQPESLLLFYRSPATVDQSGVAVTGKLDEFGAYTDLGTHGGFDVWSNVVPVGTTSGLVLFQSHSERKSAVGIVGADGGFADVNNHPDTPITPNVVSTRDGILVFYQSASEDGVGFGLAVTGRLASNGSFVALSEPRRLDLWSHIVPTVNGLVLFSLADKGIAATGRITHEGAIQDLQGFTGFDPWTHIVSTSDGILLFYNAGTGAAVTAVIDEQGNCPPLRNLTLDPGWTQIVPTTNGLLLFYRVTSSAPEAAVGRVDTGSGAFSDVSTINGLERWSTIVSVL